MKENGSDRVNALVDEVEAGKLTVSEFLRAARSMGAGDGIGPHIRPANGSSGALRAGTFRRTKMAVRIQAVGENGAGGNRIEGFVKPGATRFSHRFKEGEWDQRVVAGTGRMNVGGNERAVRGGDRVHIPRGRPFQFLNAGRQPWRFEATHPVWMPETFEYEYRGRVIPGGEMWFELKTTPEEEASRPLYNVLSAADGMGTYVVVLLEPGTATIPQFNTDGDNILTTISGTGGVAWGGAEAFELTRGNTARLVASQTFALRNESAAPILVEIRPDSPRMWQPDTSFWEVAPGTVVPGSHVWFEFVLPD